MIKVSEELLNDSVFDLESYISREFARRIGNKEEEAFFTGDGKGKPLGVLADTGGAEVGVTAAAAGAFTADEVFDLFYSLKAPYRKSAVFLMNDASVKALRKLKDSNGQYLWQPSLTAATPDTLMGRPVYTSAFMPAVAAGGIVRAYGAGGVPRYPEGGWEAGFGGGGEGATAEGGFRFLMGWTVKMDMWCMRVLLLWAVFFYGILWAVCFRQAAL